MYACYIVSFIYTCIWAELLGKRYRLCQRVWHLQLDTQNRTTEKKKTDKLKIYMKQEERWAQGAGMGGRWEWVFVCAVIELSCMPGIQYAISAQNAFGI